MKYRNLIRATALVTAVSLLPITTSALSAVDAQGTKGYADIRLFMQIYNRVSENYVEPVEGDKLMRGAIDGMLSSLDPHSSYLDARDFEQLRTQTEGAYGGLGLQVTQEDGGVKVIAPFKGTPAEVAGIKPGDYITHLDGKLIYGGTLDDAVDQMRGRPGTQIRLTIFREGRDEPFDVTLERAIITLESVTWEVKDDVGVITVSSFSENVGRDVRAAIAGIDRQLGRKPAGYVLDLRSNPGGLLDEAVELSDVFLDDGEIVSQRGRHPSENESFAARPGDSAQGLPVIVLIDAGSASASEIVAGALQDHHRALVMGERSFGKGSVQTLLPITATTALKLTTARYFTPSGRSVQEGGIGPDIAVPQISDPDYASRMRLRESDLRGHLINEIGLEDDELERDTIQDPRFTATVDELKAQGIEDFQLHYALQTVRRATEASARLAALRPIGAVPPRAPARAPARRN